MNYIVLDLEWNQAYYQKAVAVQQRLCARLRGEVIQIGAVKLDDNFGICGSYSTIVKPKFYTKIHKHVMQLTGITQAKMDAGVSFERAIESFRNFLGDEYAFLTWGPDDIPMLKENLNINELSFDWINKTYDLQKIYQRQRMSEKRQASLEEAMAELEIAQTLPAHDALNDAYFTALVAKKLDLSEGLRTYDSSTVHSQFELTVGDADVGETGYTKFTDFSDFKELNVISCPFCQKEMEQNGKLLHSKGQKYTRLYKCYEHGEFFAIAKLARNINGSFRIHFKVDAADENTKNSYLEKLKIAEEAALLRTNPQKRRRKRPAKKVQALSSEAQNK